MRTSGSCLLPLLLAASGASGKAVRTTVEANWADTSLLHEGGEFVWSAVGGEAFWSYVRGVAAELGGRKGRPSQQDRYDAALAVADRDVRMHESVGGLMGVALATRAHSPRLLSQYSLCGAIPSKHPFVVTPEGSVVNDAASLSTYLKTGEATCAVSKEGASAAEQNLAWASELGVGKSMGAPDKPRLVLCGSLEDAQFAAFYEPLAAAAGAAEAAFQLVLRFSNQTSAGGVESSDALFLQGYGVSMMIKNMEYKALDKEKKDEDAAPEEAEAAEEGDEDEPAVVAGLRFESIRERYPEQAEAIADIEGKLREQRDAQQHVADISLAVWEVQNLGLQTVYKILKSPHPLPAFASLVQDFPKHASSLSKIKKPGVQRIGKALKEAQQSHPKLYRGEGQNLLFINGQASHLADVSVHSLYDAFHQSNRLLAAVEGVLRYSAVDGLVQNSSALLAAANGFRGLLQADGGAQQAPQLRYRLPHDDVLFFNDIEKDSMYAMLPADLKSMLRPSMYGMPNYPRRNVFTSVSIMDPTSRSALNGFQIAVQLMQQGIPVRSGFLLVSTNEDPDVRRVATYLSCAFDYQWEEGARQGLMYAVTLLRNGETGGALVSMEEAIDANEGHAAMSADSEFMAACAARLERRTAQAMDRGFISTGTSEGFMFNGMFSRSADSISELFYQENAAVVEWVKTKKLKDKVKDILAWILNRTGALDAFNPAFQAAPVFADAALDAPRAALAELGGLTWFHPADYSYSTPSYSYVLSVDVTTDVGLVSVSKVVKFLENSPKAGNTRFAFVLSRSGVSAYGERYEGLAAGVQQLVRNLHSCVAAVGAKAEGARLERLKEVLLDGGDSAMDAAAPPAAAASLFACRNGVNCLTVNGRYFPLNTVFDVADYEALATVASGFVEEVHEAVTQDTTWADFYVGGPEDGAVKQLADESDSAFLSSKHFALVGLLARAKAASPAAVSVPHLTPETCPKPCRIGFHTPARTDLPLKADYALDVVAVVDPLSSEVQHLAAVLNAVHGALPLRLSVYLNPKTDLTEIPLKTFYRYVAAPALQFDDAGAVQSPVAVFHKLPEQQVLTMGMHEPEAWVVTTKNAQYDLDNIKLADVKANTLVAGYQLDYVLVTGSCIDTTSQQPPRGLPLQLASFVSARATDTLVMSNLGYFQLKATPGIWSLSILEGSKAADVYEIVSVNGAAGPGATFIFVNDFSGVHVDLKVKKLKGMEDVSILDLGEDSAAGAEAAAATEEGAPADESLFAKISGLFGGRAAPAPAVETGDAAGSKAVVARPDKPTLNIFSLATGHLYERFLKIMLHTVMLYANQPGQRVKFWYLANFLSPQFKATIEKMAADWGCEVELVTYKWPQWLNRQKEKQRVIWGYKVLFLDVLFPLDVDKIIFVDADQIMRADLHELYNLDMEGHAVAYTPFCIENANTETEGFRFWASGFWKTHLGRNPYHISAIYVVDLKRFRLMGAGDTYRAVYNQLSRDPGSLANLDQDLPNYLQDQVPIFSLPEHWLWCETWCNQESKPAAKTIDLCNNPLTKTPKLVNAKRIVPEWSSYDQLIDDWEKKQEAQAGAGQ
eukprot:TRINITY_DN15864_c0_g1_i1.p1 TRINITY_DN15864_c0_g1~~TRINITY_DN15864_c0_g1_i1.p1  ORF type:complete len:1574 (+),score=604.26 TRINITY_DN15864_c0_g1_i1:65-4786(+)